MEFNLSQALERRLKVIPNKATVGIQAQIQDTKLEFPKFPRAKYISMNDFTDLYSKNKAVKKSVSEESDYKSVKVGTEDIPEQPVKQKEKKKSPTMKYRLRGVMGEDTKDLDFIDKTNKFLKRKVTNDIIRKMQSCNERPPGTPRSIVFQPSYSPSLSYAFEKKKTQSPRTRECTDFVQHNKQTLFNLKPDGSRPVLDTLWVKTMRKSAAFQKYSAYQNEDLVNKKQFINSSLDYNQDPQTLTKSFWKYNPSSSISLNTINFNSLQGDLEVNPTYSYCKTCRKGTTPITLKGRNSRIDAKKV